MLHIAPIQAIRLNQIDQRGARYKTLNTEHSRLFILAADTPQPAGKRRKTPIKFGVYTALVLVQAGCCFFAPGQALAEVHLFGDWLRASEYPRI